MKKVDWKTCLKVGVTVFLVYLCIHYWDGVAGFLGTVIGAATPLLVGCGIAYVLNILMSFYERHYFPKATKNAAIKSRRPVCMILSIVTLVAIVALVMLMVVPELVSCVKLLIEEVPEAIAVALDWLESKGIIAEDVLAKLETVDWKSKVMQVIDVLIAGIGNVAEVAIDVVSSVVSGVVTAVVGIIFAIYLLLGKEKLGSQATRVMKRYMKPKWLENVTRVLAVLNDSFHRYIVGQCIEAVILGSLCAIGMLILRIPYAAMVGALISVTAFIPVAGAWIGAGVGAFMIMTEDPMKAIIFLIFIVVLQQLENNLIYPRVVGSSLGLPAIWVLAAITVGGSIMGIGGMLLAVPLASAIYRLVRDNVNNPKKVKAEAAQENAPEPVTEKRKTQTKL